MVGVRFKDLANLNYSLLPLAGEGDRRADEGELNKGKLMNKLANRTSLKNKIVFITGASSGIGAACAKYFAEQGANLILCARRADKLQALSDKLHKQFTVKIKTLVLDIRDKLQIDQQLHSLADDWRKIDVLVNNAGLARGKDKLYEGKYDDWDEMIDTNIKGLLYITKQILPNMHKKNHGHIINMSSISGHDVYPGGSVYCATKFAVDALTKGLRADLLGTNIRVTAISPGLVETEFSQIRYHGDMQRAQEPYTGIEPLTADDIADAVIYAATCPANVNISEIIMTPVAQASVLLTHRVKSV